MQYYALERIFETAVWHQILRFLETFLLPKCWRVFLINSLVIFRKNQWQVKNIQFTNVSSCVFFFSYNSHFFAWDLQKYLDLLINTFLSSWFWLGHVLRHLDVRLWKFKCSCKYCPQPLILPYLHDLSLPPSQGGYSCFCHPCYFVNWSVFEIASMDLFCYLKCSVAVCCLCNKGLW